MDATPLGLDVFVSDPQGSALGAQPWAERWNPVGILRSSGRGLGCGQVLHVFYLLFAFLTLAASHAAEFAVYDIYLDTHGKPLAAYQLKVWDKSAAIKIISIEGGEHPAFQKAPFFDPKAIQRDVIKLAAFNSGNANELPTKKFRVASIHVEIGPGLTPKLAIEVEAAARPGGKKIVTDATITRRITK